MSSYLIPIMAVGRMAIGGGCVAAPKLLCDLFFTPFTPATSIAWRLFGARDFAVGTFLFLSKDKDPKPALMLGLAVDCIDVVSTAICVAEGNLEWEPVVSLGGGAALLVLMGWIALRGVASGQGVALKATVLLLIAPISDYLDAVVGRAFIRNAIPALSVLLALLLSFGSAFDPLPQDYFQENPNSSHYDLRFSQGTWPHQQPPLSALAALLDAFLLTMNDLGIEAWLAHNTLLGWYWGKQFQPWDVDITFHISHRDLVFLSKYYNMTVYGGRDDERTYYLLDINPLSLLDEERPLGSIGTNQDHLSANAIDARWIDMSRGVFIDLIALTPVKSRSGNQILKANDGYTYLATDVYPLRASTFEGLDVLVPQSPAVLLSDDFSKDALTRKVFRGYEYSYDLQEWLPLS